MMNMIAMMIMKNDALDLITLADCTNIRSGSGSEIFDRLPDSGPPKI